jgi:LytS/YehU family sensor histidine kinase
MDVIAKETKASKAFDQVKRRSKKTWMPETGEPFSRRLEKDAEWFFRRLGFKPEIRLFDVGYGATLNPSFGVAVLARSLESKERSLAEAQAEKTRYQEELRQKELNEEKLRSLATRSRLNALISQINPHFLFNALNTVGVLIEENPEEARRLTIKMANIFRQTLRASEREMVSLHEELSFIQDYLEIEKARFGERLRVEQTVAVADAEIPCFTVQLLIENAIKHGASPKVGTTTIRILALQVRDRIQIQVSDDGVGMPKDALDHILERGYGLRNLIERLNILYASDFSWHVESELQKGTAVSLQLPFFPRFVLRSGDSRCKIDVRENARSLISLPRCE